MRHLTSVLINISEKTLNKREENEALDKCSVNIIISEKKEEMRHLISDLQSVILMHVCLFFGGGGGRVH